MSKQWTEDMGEISGFGGSYEARCRAMVLGGIKYIDEHPNKEIKFHSYKDIYGIVIEDNDAAKALTKAMMDEPVYQDGKLLQERAGVDCTGAMHHAATDHCLAYKRLGWEEYRKQLRERKD